MPLQFKFLLLGLLLNLAHAERVAPTIRNLRVPILKTNPIAIETGTKTSVLELPTPTQAGILKLDT